MKFNDYMSGYDSFFGPDGLAKKHCMPRLSPEIFYSEFGAMMALITGCLLLDTEFVVPEVLNRDKDKPLTEERIERARSNGKVGWDIGKEMDVNPHWRRPHPALMWTGKGRTVARITMRKGTIVKRSTIGQVPTGFMDKDQSNDN